MFNLIFLFFSFFLLGVNSFLYFMLILVSLFTIKFLGNNKSKISSVKKKYNKIKISILIPIYNEEYNLNELLISIYNNKYIDLYEIIFINDSSTDNSLDILNELKKKYKFKVFTVPKQNNVANVLNLGLQYVHEKSNFVGIINGDCILSNNCLDKVLFRLENFNINVLNMSNYSKKYEKMTFYMFCAYIEKKFKNYLFTYDQSWLNNGYFIKKDLLFKLNGWESITEDLNLSLKLIRNNISIYQDPEIIIHDSLPTDLLSFEKQKYRWVYGDILSRISYNPKSLIDIIINIYYFIPLYLIIGIIFKINIFNIMMLQSSIIVGQIIFHYKSNNYQNFGLSIFYSLFQFIFKIYFYFKFFLKLLWYRKIIVKW